MTSRIILLIGVVLFVACKDVYHPPIKEEEAFLLVVEGVLNVGGRTVIHLSRSTSLNSNRRVAEQDAQVIVEGRGLQLAVLEEKDNGRYVAENLPLEFNKEYRIVIQASGKKYISDFVTAKKSPAIDSISWTRDDDGIDIEVSTHDSQNNTRYYKWEYEETWEINSMYGAAYKYVNGSVLPIQSTDPQMFFCWKYFNSTSVITSTSSSLANDIIDRKRFLFIPTAHEKLSVRYSVLVRQYAIEKRAYEFFEMMRKNTEALGTIFDPQPFEMDGNLRCETNPSEKVIGYMFASSASEERLYISKAEVDRWGFQMACDDRLVANHLGSIRKYMPTYLPYSAIPSGGPPTDYNSALAECVDCRVRGGINVRPSFW